MDSLIGRFALGDFLPHEIGLVLAESVMGGMTEGRLVVLDFRLRQRLELQVLPNKGYESRGGSQYPAAGLQVIRVWETAGMPGSFASGVWKLIYCLLNRGGEPLLSRKGRCPFCGMD